MVEPAIREAKVLQALAKANGLVANDADRLIAEAEDKKKAGQTEDAFLMADEATLQLQVALQERENKTITDSLRTVTESLNVYRNALETRKKGR
jgi:protein involved in polysaccharide export with SLBB domain